MLRPQLLTVTPGPLARTIAVGIAFTVASTVVAIAVSSDPEDRAELVGIDALMITETPADAEPVHVPLAVTVAAAPVPAAVAPQRAEFLFAFSAGGATYVKLADVEGDADKKTLPKHGKLILREDDPGSVAALAVVATADMPEAYRGYLGTPMIVDSTCKAKVVGFAVVSRLVGDPGYAAIEGSAWTVDSVMRTGSTVLAARVDLEPEGSCKGTYARDAAQSPIVALASRTDEALADAARSALLASAITADTQREWAEQGGEGTWHEHVALESTVVRHPKTGVTWVVVHASFSESCGGPNVNVYGLFRVARDGSLATVAARKLDDLYSIEKIIDSDGDGTPELVGRPWLGLETVRASADGTAIDRLALPFYGCPC